MTILLVKLKKEKKWIEFSSIYFELKLFKVKFSHNESLQLMYKNKDTAEKIKYLCENCGSVVECGWLKFVVNQIKKNKCLCRICSIKTKENREKISKRTRQAMQSQIVKKNHSIGQKKRFQREDERKKRSILSKEIISRPGMKEFISKQTKKAMSKIPSYELVATKNMTNSEKKDFYKAIGEKISIGYNKKVYEKMIKSRNQHFSNNKKAQGKIITQTRKRNLLNMTVPQKKVTQFLYELNAFTVIPEFPINVWDDERFTKKFIISDIYIKELNLIIEVLGDYWHKYFISYLQHDNVNFNNENLYDIYVRDLEKDLIYKTLNFNIIYFFQENLSNSNWEQMLLEQILGI